MEKCVTSEVPDVSVSGDSAIYNNKCTAGGGGRGTNYKIWDFLRKYLFLFKYKNWDKE